MLGKIIYISDNIVTIQIEKGAILEDIMNKHIVFEDKERRILGEVEDIGETEIKVKFMGEFVNNVFVGGVISKPNLTAKIRIIRPDELGLIIGENREGNFLLGTSPLYDNYPIMGNINAILSGHTAIFGNSGSGKSCGVSRLIQNIFYDKRLFPFRSNILIFDAYGEYHNAFSRLNEVNPNYHFKYYTTDKTDANGERLMLPLWLMDVEDIAILLQAEKHNQLMIIERILKMVYIFAMGDEISNKYKNHLIAKAIMGILYTNETSAAKRNDIFNLIANCSTPEFSLNTQIQGVGYVRQFKDCFEIHSGNGSFVESVLITEYLNKFIDEELDQYEAPERKKYNLVDLEKALNFVLIGEGMLNNEETYSAAIMLKVKLHSLVIGPYKEFFDVEEFITMDQYMASLFTKEGNKKTQITNINLEDIDDWFAKFITKAMVKLMFGYTKGLKKRASIPVHIFIEEAHRYVQNDNDAFLLGYNIFERVSKEGRKYGLLLNLISQRPVDISDTVISQVANFFIFKLNHPKDLEYVRQMLPNISNEIVEKQKTLQPGTCISFGSSFKIPLIIKMQMPNPAPMSSSCDVFNTWNVKQEEN